MARKHISLILALVCCMQVLGQGLDYRMLRTVHVNRQEGLDPAMLFVTNAGPVVALSLPIGYGTGALLGLYDEDKSMSASLGLSMLSTMGVTYLLKSTIKRARPYETYADFNSGYTAHSPSFPSGPSSSAFAFATSTMLLTKGKKYHIPLSILSYTFAGTVAYSRMHLGVHYPSDVLVGSVIGVACSYFSFWLVERVW